ncbi:MAG TPA: hypothetical protein VGI57_12735, partial [Usitatibacter sp.]
IANGAQAPIATYVYDAALATVTAIPQTATPNTDDYISYGIVMRDVHRFPLSTVSIQARDVTYVGGPGLANSGSYYSSTNSAGQFNISLRNGVQTNSVPGRYEIGLYAAGRQFRIPVIQSLRGQLPPPPLPAIASPVQDMWWGGPAANGWGVSIIEHRDTLFAVIYAYDDQTDSSRWYVVPGGTWDDSHTRYTGPIYMPHGAPFRSYDASRLQVGDSLGTATFMFVDANNVTLDVEMRGNLAKSQYGRTALTRQQFGSGASTLTNLGDMWWGGSSQNGWGISVLQQAGALFAVWFTYGDDGLPTWYVMPTGTWTAPDTYEGRLYVTRNSSDWMWPASYVPERLKVNDAGPFRLRFKPDGSASFDYTVGNTSGSLALSRQPF